MYKVKLFRNMSGLVAGQSLKQMITNKDWWKGVFGNMLSTIIGIALTIGVAALVEHHNDKKQSREMMFNVVKTAHDDIPVMELLDSANHVQIEAVVTLLDLYLIESSQKLDKVSEDSIAKLLGRTYFSNRYILTRSDIDKYFYSAQMMHQFNNPEIYAKFAEFVSFDTRTFDSLLGMQQLGFDMERKIKSKVLFSKDNVKQIAKGLIDDNTLYNYYFALQNLRIHHDTEEYKKYYKNLLKCTGATEEEFQEYVKNNTVPDDSIK